MLFNSLQFFYFFVVIYLLYLSLPYRWQNRMLLVASYIFYGSWDWRFLSLIWIVTLLNYLCGKKIHAASDLEKQKILLIIGITGSLLILGAFKYCNFFIEGLQALIRLSGLAISVKSFNIILPVGISFYTFQALGYTIDIYRREIKPAKKFLDFALFVAFFPQLVAGPIERAKRLLPQMQAPRTVTLEKFYQGCYLIFWGIFIKVFVADNLGNIVDPVFASESFGSGALNLLVLYAFSFQIYCDFAGYSHIARGLAYCMGFDIMVNFNLPYFSSHPKEFWEKWHISLSSWLRDYVYISLGGNRHGALLSMRNVLITMLLGGLWHGAAWTFVLWGAYHGLLVGLYRIRIPFFRGFLKMRHVWADRTLLAIKVLLFFHLCILGWALFRAESLGQAGIIFNGLFTNFNLSDSTTLSATGIKFAFFVGPLLVYQTVQCLSRDFFWVLKTPWLFRTCFYMLLYYLITIYGVIDGREFIYFQF